jgi:hypothetical protein
LQRIADPFSQKNVAEVAHQVIKNKTLKDKVRMKAFFERKEKI